MSDADHMQTPEFDVHEKLQQAYVLAWQELREWYVTGQAQRLSPSAYERAVYSRVRCVLDVLAEALDWQRKGSSGLGLGRAIVYVNSIAKRTRIRLPFWGGGHEERKCQGDWKKLVHKSDGRDLMFLDPGRPRHILTESMWRLRDKKQWGTGSCVAIFTERDKLWDICSDYREIFAVPLFADNHTGKWYAKTPGGAPLDSIAKIAESLGHAGENSLWESLRSILNDRLDELQGKMEFDIGEYSKENIWMLFERPLRLLPRAASLPGPSPTNIFYLTDVVETEEVGAVDGGVVCCRRANVQAPDVCEFLKKVQWLCSTYVIRLVTTAELSFAAGKAYPDEYFYEKAPTKVKTSGVGSLISALDKCSGDLGAGMETASDVFECLKRHFRHAQSPRGKYWVGYPKQSFEVACCVSELMELILGRKGLGDKVRSCGPKLADLDQLLHKRREPLVIRQLFRALEAEHELFSVPRYREHFIHSFHVFVIGMLILAWRPSKVLPTEAPDLTLGDSTLRDWFVVAMWHDIAYLLQSMRGIGEALVRRQIGEEHLKRISGFLPLNPHFGDLVQQVEQWLEVIASVRNTWDGMFKLPPKIRNKKLCSAGDLTTAAALDRNDHGFWSALLLAHALRAGTPLKGDAKELRKWSRLGRIISAVAPHHLADWDLGELLASFARRVKGKYDVPFPNVDDNRSTLKGTRIDWEHNSLGYLLGLCDMLAQAGREAEDIAGAAPSRIKARFAYVGRDPKVDNALMIELHYEGDKRKPREIIKKHFTDPAVHLGLQPVEEGKKKDGTICVRVSSKVGKAKPVWLEHE